MEEELGRISVTRGTQTNERIWRTKTVAVDARTGQCFWRPELEAGGLLPGLPNDITLDGIVSKLPWTAFSALLSVSRHWREAIESRQVFNARVRSNSTETLFVIRSQDRQEISLYSIRDKRCYQLPRIPHLSTLEDSGITSVDGKIYVLGGWRADHYMDEADLIAFCRRVYVFDPAGQREWRRCADMLEPKDRIRCGVVEGKIYVFSRGVYGIYDDIAADHGFDGYDDGDACRPEVYDPKGNAWSEIEGMTSTRFSLSQVLTLGEEMFLLGRDWDSWNAHPLLSYHTVKDEWRVVERFPEHDYCSVFIAQGKFHLMSGVGIHFLDDEKNAWQDLHWHAKQSSAADAEEADEDDFIEVGDVIRVGDVIEVDDELFSVMRWSNIVGSFSERESSAVFRSRGFRSDRDELLWQQEAAFEDYSTFQCTVQL